MKTPKNRFFRLLFDSAWFPAVAWLLGVGLLCGVVIAGAPVRHWCGRWAAEGLGWLALGLVAALTVTGAVAFVRSLAGRRWGRAAVQLLLGAVALVAGVVGYFIADFVSREVAFRTPGVVDWQSAMAPGEPFQAVTPRWGSQSRSSRWRRQNAPQATRCRLGGKPRIHRPFRARWVWEPPGVRSRSTPGCNTSRPFRALNGT